MNRTKARETAFKALFQLDFAPEEEKNFYEELSIENALEEGKVPPKRRMAYIESTVKGTRANLEKIDEIITPHLKKGWTLKRLSAAERNILRLAVFEMLFAEEKVAAGIIINEAVELAKQYGEDESSRFVNAVLSAIDNES